MRPWQTQEYLSNPGFWGQVTWQQLAFLCTSKSILSPHEGFIFAVNWKDRLGGVTELGEVH